MEARRWAFAARDYYLRGFLYVRTQSKGKPLMRQAIKREVYMELPLRRLSIRCRSKYRAENDLDF